MTRLGALSLGALLLVWTPPPLLAQSGSIITVTGPINPSTLGHTLMHEHLFSDFNPPDQSMVGWLRAGRQRPVGATAVRLYQMPLNMGILADVMLGAPNRSNWLLDDPATALNELQEYRKRGGSALVDLTGIGRGRDPDALLLAARQSGVSIVMGTGWYTEAWHPKGLEQLSTDSLSHILIQELTVGVTGTGIRAGIIGEIGIEDKASEVEIRILRAVARASRETGAAIALHFEPDSRRHQEVINLLKTEGVDLRRVILSHLDDAAGKLPYLVALAEQGVTLSFDQLGEPPLVTRVRPIDSEVGRSILALVQAGFSDRILFSQNIHARINWKAYGGTGYSFIEESFLPWLKRQGITPAQLDQIMIENPRQLLTLAAPSYSTDKELQ